MAELRSVTLKINVDMFEQIQLIADKRGETISAAIRHLIERGLSERVYEENTDIISRVVKTQMEQVMKSYAILLTRRNVECPEKASGEIPERVSLLRNSKNLYA